MSIANSNFLYTEQSIEVVNFLKFNHFEELPAAISSEGFDQFIIINPLLKEYWFADKNHLEYANKYIQHCSKKINHVTIKDLRKCQN